MSKHQPSPIAVSPQSEAEALVVQHALALYRDTKALAKNAPHGQFLNCAEALVVAQGRELLKTTLQTLVQEEIDDIEKKKRHGSVRSACRKGTKRRKDIGADRKNKSKPPPDK